MTYGYARISRKTQSLERQRRNIIEKAPAAKIYEEAFTGTTMKRPEWEKLMKRVRRGDTIVFDSVSRMSRTAEDGVSDYMELYAKGVNLVFIKEPHIDTEVYRQAAQPRINTVGEEIADYCIEFANGLIQRLARKQIVIAFEQAEKEVKDLQIRTKEGMKAAGAVNERDADGNITKQGSVSRNRTGIKYSTAKVSAAREIIAKHCKDFGGSLTDKECIKMAGVSRSSFYSIKAALKGGA